MKFGITILSFLMLLLTQSCMLYNMMDDGDMKAEDEIYFEEMAAEEGSMMESIAENEYAPLLIEGGHAKHVLYSGLPNSIKIHVQGRDTRHLKITTNGGRLDTVDASKGMYSYRAGGVGFKTEIVAENTLTGESTSTAFDVIEVPAPGAYIGTYRRPVKNKQSFTVKEFKKQSAIVLHHPNVFVPARCDATSYTMVRIDKEGKRTMHTNNVVTGEFDETAKKMVDAVQSGDIYIFKNIKANCSSSTVKNIVFYID